MGLGSFWSFSTLLRDLRLAGLHLAFEHILITFVLPSYQTNSLGLPCKNANCIFLYRSSCPVTT